MPRKAGFSGFQFEAAPWMDRILSFFVSSAGSGYGTILCSACRYVCKGTGGTGEWVIHVDNAVDDHGCCVRRHIF